MLGRKQSCAALSLLTASSALAFSSNAFAATMVVDGENFVPLEGAKFDISPHTETAIVSSRAGSLVATKGEYEVFGDLIYVSQELAMSELQPFNGGGIVGNLPANLNSWVSAPIIGIPVAGLAIATAWQYLSPGVLRFTNDAEGSIFENETAVSFTPSLKNVKKGVEVTYSLTGEGNDDAAFTIDPLTGQLTFNTAPNFEMPDDANGDNIYDVEIEVTDGKNTAFQAAALTVNNVDEAPSWVSGPVATASENSTATSYVADGYDEDSGSVLSYRLTGDGPDDGLFSIDADTGVLRFITAPNFEAPADSDANNSFELELEVSDGVNTSVRSLIVSLADVNEAPVLTSAISGSMDELGLTTSYTATATDVDAGDSQTYSIVVEGADDGFFTIHPTTGVLGLNAALDFENPTDLNGDGDYEFDIEVMDSGGLTDRISVSMTLMDVDEAPVFENAGPFTVQENSVAGTSVGNVDANNGDGGTTDTNVTYAITGGTGAAFFTINSSSGEVTVTNSNTLDFDATASYVIEVTATDAVNPALTTVQNYTVNLTDENEAPVFTSATTLSIAENATSPTLTNTVTDPEGDAITWSIIGGADQGDFSLSAAGVLSLPVGKDFENPDDANTNGEYEVTVRADDGNGNQTDQPILVTITNANEAPVFTSGTSVTMAENATATGYTAVATDSDGHARTYSIAGSGADDALFTIDGTTGVLSFISAPDFDTPGSGAGSNAYTVDLVATDPTALTDAITVTVNVTNVNEQPVISTGTVATATENSTATSYTLAATDPDGTTPTYSISGGADAALFQITAGGVLSFLAAPDREAPGDVGADNVYDVVLQATDGALSDTVNVAITVNNADEAPIFTSINNFSMAEDTTIGTEVANFIGNDGDGGAADTGITYSIVGGTGAGDFAVDGTTGALTLTNMLDFEGGTTSFDLDIQLSDGVNTTLFNDLIVTLTNANDAPVMAASSTTLVNEDQLPTGFTATHTDADVGDTHTYSLVSTATNDSAFFSIDGTSGVLNFLVAPDHDVAAQDFNGDYTYDIEIQVTDGAGATNSQVYFIDLVDVA